MVLPSGTMSEPPDRIVMALAEKMGLLFELCHFAFPSVL